MKSHLEDVISDLKENKRKKTSSSRQTKANMADSGVDQAGSSGVRMTTAVTSNKDQPQSHSASDSGEQSLRILMTNISKDLYSSISCLTDRLQNLEQNIEKTKVSQLTTVIHNTVREEIQRVRSDFDSEIDALKTKIQELEGVFSDLTRGNGSGESAGPATKSAPPDDKLRKLIIKRMSQSRAESTAEGPTSSGCVKNKVIPLVRDGLKMKDARVIDAVRRPSKGDHPGLTIATFKSEANVKEFLKNKSELRKTNDYRDVYIEPFYSHTELMTQNSFRTVLKEMGKDQDYIVHGPRVFRKHNRSGPGNGSCDSNARDQRPANNGTRDRQSGGSVDGSSRLQSRSPQRYNNARGGQSNARRLNQGVNNSRRR